MSLELRIQIPVPVRIGRIEVGGVSRAAPIPIRGRTLMMRVTVVTAHPRVAALILTLGRTPTTQAMAETVSRVAQILIPAATPMTPVMAETVSQVARTPIPAATQMTPAMAETVSQVARTPIPAATLTTQAMAETVSQVALTLTPAATLTTPVMAETVQVVRAVLWNRVVLIATPMMMRAKGAVQRSDFC